MKLYQRIALAIKNGNRLEVDNMLPDGITLHFESYSNKFILSAQYYGMDFDTIVYPDFVDGFSLGFRWDHKYSDKLCPVTNHFKHIFTELLNQD